MLIENSLDTVNSIKGCVFDGNEASSAGAIYLNGGEIKVENSIFERNHAIYSRGGGIYAFESVLNVLSCNFVECYALLDSGAIFGSKTNIYIEKTNFTSN